MSVSAFHNITREFSQNKQIMHSTYKTISQIWQKEISEKTNTRNMVVLNYLTHPLIHHFETSPNSKKLQTTTEMWLLTHYHTMTPFDAPGKQAF